MRRISITQSQEEPGQGCADPLCDEMNAFLDEAAEATFAWPHLDLLCPVLAKSCEDFYSYTIGLRDGSRINYEHATLSQNAKWLSLEGVSYVTGPISELPQHTFARGIDVSISNILWAVDMPS